MSTVPSDPAAPKNQELKKRAKVGMAMLAVRSALQNLVILVANVYLARRLSPADYGIFGILQFALSLFRLIGDTGLAAALVQKKEEPSDLELSSIWWFQLLLGLGLVLASASAVPVLPLIWHSLPEGAKWLLPGLSLSLLFTMLQVVPMLVLERQVQFGWVGTLEFLGTLAYYGTAVGLAFRGAGAAALVWASVGQAALVALLANVVQPWRPKFVFSLSAIRGLLKFGFAFQGNNIVGFINSAVTPLFAGAKLGSSAFGMLQFAESTAFFPSLAVGIVRRVHFPFLSRLQHDRPAFVREFETATLLCAAPCLLFFGMFVGGAPAIISIVYGQKWLPAVPALYVYSFGFCFAFYSWIGSAAIEALGHASKILRVSVIATLTNWLAVALAAFVWKSILAFAWGYFLHLALAPVLMHFIIKGLVPGVRPIRRILKIAPAAIVSGLVTRSAIRWVTSPGLLVLWILANITLFCAMALWLDAGLREAALQRIRRLLSSPTADTG